MSTLPPMLTGAPRVFRSASPPPCPDSAAGRRQGWAIAVRLLPADFARYRGPVGRVQHRGPVGVARNQRDADAAADAHRLVLVQIVGQGNRGNDAFAQFARFGLDKRPASSTNSSPPMRAATAIRRRRDQACGYLGQQPALRTATSSAPNRLTVERGRSANPGGHAARSRRASMVDTSMSFSRYEAMDMDVMRGTCTSTSHRMDSWVNSAPSAQADADHRRRQARAKLRTQMPPTIDAADRHASVAAIQSPLSRLMKGAVARSAPSRAPAPVGPCAWACRRAPPGGPRSIPRCARRRPAFPAPATAGRAARGGR